MDNWRDKLILELTSRGLPSQVAKWERTHLPMQEMQKTWVWSLGLDPPLVEDISNHFSILAGKILWKEEAGRPQSMGLQSQTRLSTDTQVDIITH